MQEHIHFDGWTLLRPTGELWRGEARVRLQGQPLQVLEALLERPGELVTREQLIVRLWPRGVIVDFDTALNSAIRRVRTALDDHADHPRYIETIPRRGYRFICPVDTLDPGRAVTATSAAQPSQGAAAVPAPVAVPADAAPAGRLISLAGWTAAAAALALLLAGYAWSVVGDEDPLTRTAAAGRPGAAKVPAAARERYERGRFFFGRRGEGDMARALASYQEALQVDRGLAAAWAGIASVRWIDTMEGRMTRAEGLPLVREAAEHALALEPVNGEALMRLANYHGATGDRVAAEALLQRAVVAAPDDPLVLTILSGRAREAGRVDEAVRLQRRAVQHDPLAQAPRYNLMVLLFVARRYDEARAEYRELSAVTTPRFPPDTVIGQSILLGGDPAGALDFARTLPAGAVRDQLEALSYHALGKKAESDAALRRLEADPSQSTAYRVAEVRAFRGETDAAFHWLSRGLGTEPDDCPRRECWPEEWIAELPLLQALHADPRWPAIQAALVTPAARPRRSS